MLSHEKPHEKGGEFSDPKIGMITTIRPATQPDMKRTTISMAAFTDHARRISARIENIEAVFIVIFPPYRSHIQPVTNAPQKPPASIDCAYYHI